jgi:hypothetical protein
VLQGHHPAGTETAAITGAFNLVLNIRGCIAGTEEVSVLGVDCATLASTVDTAALTACANTCPP